jgi:hypothetical protein
LVAGAPQARPIGYNEAAVILAGAQLAHASGRRVGGMLDLEYERGWGKAYGYIPALPGALRAVPDAGSTCAA